MKDVDPIRTDGRRRRRLNRFGPNPQCLFCPCTDLEALTLVKVGWLEKHGIELHHVVEERRDPELEVPLCLNCHRKVTEGLAQAGISNHYEQEPRELVAQMLDALAVFLEFVIEALRRWANILRETLRREALPCD